MRNRLITALIGIPLVIGALGINSPWPLFGLAAIAIVLAARELGALYQDMRLGAVFGALMLAGVAAYGVWGSLEWLGPVCLGAYGVAAVFGYSIRAGWRTIMKWLSPLWILLPVIAALLTFRVEPEANDAWHFRPILWPLLVLWAGDSAAYAVGKMFGKHKFAPDISPKKTWEGAIAHVIASIAAGAGFAGLFGFHWMIGVYMGVAAGTLGQAGDLLESSLKRVTGAKDSGQLLPGHGGILDRLDSYFLLSPIATLLMAIDRQLWP